MNILRWFISFVGTQLLALVVWFVGPLWAPLEPMLPRSGAIAALAVLWAIGNLALDLRRMSRERRLVAGVSGGKRADGAEAAALQEKLTGALDTLRRAKGKRFSLYERPWYAIIGPPGAGKTTALLNAGLDFPLADSLGRSALAGVGGTRLCEWWFTEQAVLIDTAGRYTTQDSDAAADKAGWDAFLALLKRTRPRQPLNGVIVAIALADVVGDTARDDRLQHAAAIRRRIAELETQLRIRLPVYAVLTKADLLAGFGEFFGDLDREGREQVWGLTLPYRRGAIHDVAAAFTAEAKLWLNALEQRMLLRLQAESSAERRALLSGFPAQFATVGAPVAEFLGAAFARREKERPPLLRGVYFTSATQEGTPIDRLTGALARAFGLESGRARRQRPEAGRSFFITGLLRDVIFREAMLGTASASARRRAEAARAAGFVLCLGALLAGGALLWQHRLRATDEIQQAQAALAGYEQDVAALRLDPVRDGDLPRLLPLLDRARALPFGADAPPASDLLPLGLSQSAKLAAAAQTVYRHGLEYAFFPRLLWSLEAQLRGNLADPEYEYSALRVYLMLGNVGPLDREIVRQWMVRSWEELNVSAEIRDDLARHLDALLRNPLPKVELDGQVVQAAQATFARVGLAQRVYSRIKPAVAGIPAWRPSDALGQVGVTVFIRASGRALSDGIPGLFTLDGYRKGFLPALGPALQAVAAESWVLGAKTNLEPDSPSIRAAAQEVVSLYAADYIAAWDALLADLDVAPIRSTSQAAQDLFVLASREHSPMRALLAAIAQQTKLDAPEMRAVDDHFRPLQDIMRPGVIDQVLKPLTDLQQALAKMAASANRVGAAPDPGSADPVVALQTEAIRQPAPFSRWLASIASSGRALRGGGLRDQLVAAFKAGGGIAALCPQVITGKYPFTAATDKDVSLEEFARLFGPGGVIDAYVNTYLKPYVDTTGRAWKLQQVEGVSAPFGPADLQNFQRAQTIRDLFFGARDTAPKLRFDLTPLGAEPAGSTATLDLGGGVTLQAGAGPPRPAQLVWPPPKPGPASLTWAPPGTGLRDEGAWALFRLFGRGQFAATSGDRSTLTLRDGDRAARFDMRAAQNPFATHALQEFRCPTIP